MNVRTFNVIVNDGPFQPVRVEQIHVDFDRLHRLTLDELKLFLKLLEKGSIRPALA